jgi:chromosome segregation ATPase
MVGEENDKQSETLADIKKQTKEVIKISADLKAKNQDLEELLKKKDGLIEQLKGDIGDEQEKYSGLKSSYERKILAVKKNIEDVMVRYTKEHDDLEARYKECEYKLKAKEDEIALLNKSFSEIKIEYAALKKKSEDELINTLPEKLNQATIDGTLNTYKNEIENCNKKNKNLKYAAALLSFLTLGSVSYTLISNLHQKNNVKQEEIVDLKTNPYYFEIKEFERTKASVKDRNLLFYLDKCIAGFNQVNDLDVNEDFKDDFRDGYMRAVRIIGRGKTNKAIEEFNALESYIANTIKDEIGKKAPRTREAIIKEIEIIKKQPKTDKGSSDLSRLRAELAEFDKKK